MSDPEGIGAPSMFKFMRNTASLARMWPTVDLISEENTVRQQWKVDCARSTPREVQDDFFPFSSFIFFSSNHSLCHFHNFFFLKTPRVLNSLLAPKGLTVICHAWSQVEPNKPALDTVPAFLSRLSTPESPIQL